MRLRPSRLPPLARPPPARPVPPRNYLPETRYRDSSDLPVRNRLPGGWGGGRRESRAGPSLPVSIRYKRDGVRIRVKSNFSVIFLWEIQYTWPCLLILILSMVTYVLLCKIRMYFPEALQLRTMHSQDVCLMVIKKSSQKNLNKLKHLLDTN